MSRVQGTRSRDLEYTRNVVPLASDTTIIS